MTSRWRRRWGTFQSGEDWEGDTINIDVSVASLAVGETVIWNGSQFADGSL